MTNTFPPARSISPMILLCRSVGCSPGAFASIATNKPATQNTTSSVLLP
jgi:hypothetical protein